MEKVKKNFFIFKDKLEWFFNSWYFIIALSSAFFTSLLETGLNSKITQREIIAL